MASVLHCPEQTTADGNRAISRGLAWVDGVRSAENIRLIAIDTGSSAPDAWWIAPAAEVKDDDRRPGGRSNLIVGNRTGAATTWLTAACWYERSPGLVVVFHQQFSLVNVCSTAMETPKRRSPWMASH
jgi:hypothetical protein